MSGQQRQEEQRKRIQVAAKDLFLKNGYSKTKIKDIAQAAHISPSTIYLYFSDKRQLFLSLELPELDENDQEWAKRRDELNRTALTYFGEYGFEATKMADIAQAMGVAKSSLYQYCSGKEQLYFQVLESYIHGNPPSQEDLGMTQENWRDVIRSIAETYMELSHDSSRTAFLGTVIRDSSKFPEFGGAYYDHSLGVARDRMLNFLRPLQISGEISSEVKLDQAATVFFFALTAYMLFFRIMRGVQCDIPESGYVDALCRMFIAGLES